MLRKPFRDLCPSGVDWNTTMTPTYVVAAVNTVACGQLIPSLMRPRALKSVISVPIHKCVMEVH